MAADHNYFSNLIWQIARETTKLDGIRVATERTIALLKERRGALIAAAVTGQIDVTREVGPRGAH